MKIGANYRGNGTCEFVVWAPFKTKVELKIILPEEKIIPMQKDEWGYWKATIEGCSSDHLYFYRLDDEKDRPDPASHFQSQGVHGPSQIIDHAAFDWEDENWKGIDLAKMIMYELHVGTFTPEGTFEAIIPRLGALKEIGINAVELMPVAQFPGERNWGYDGVYPFAVQNSYGGPNGLKRLVNACHQNGIAVILDVVYNHLGPEGNYFWAFGPYFTDKYKTPWGKALNFDDVHSDAVRNFFIENALHWFENYHLDAIRLDAVHAIFDMSARPFLQKLAERVEEFSKNARRKFYLIAESNLNDTKIIRLRELGGFGMEAQWCDDFHHSLRTLVTGENRGYYVDFGRVEQFVKCWQEGFVYSGQYSPYRKRRHGNSSKDMPAQQFVVFSQNHDQVGNRMLGERLSTLVSFEALKLVAGAVILSPYIPMLFMGEEYGEAAPFIYFVSHSDANLIEAVRKGRKEEFKSFNWIGEPPDPQSVDTFLKSKLDWKKRAQGNHSLLLDFYKNLIKLRNEMPALANLDKDALEAVGFEENKIVLVRRWKGQSQVLLIFNFNNAEVAFTASLYKGIWEKILDSSDKIWSGPGMMLPERITPGKELTIKGHSFAVYKKQ
ncbi:malto-oligosyltrehalose trehalohydrolase [candidate division KSB1 bacterium]|nr:malto-oligosyltrehalose trehalohydrolase [candidate division KSB1 bacterium]